ncbi:hypothetical protein HEP73_00288 [Xanthomonas sp. GW]|nr:hypothetical protein HEP73_00288 [Xanthomonas sp. GW]
MTWQRARKRGATYAEATRQGTDTAAGRHGLRVGQFQHFNGTPQLWEAIVEPSRGDVGGLEPDAA